MTARRVISGIAFPLVFRPLYCGDLRFTGLAQVSRPGCQRRFSRLSGASGDDVRVFFRERRGPQLWGQYRSPSGGLSTYCSSLSGPPPRWIAATERRYQRKFKGRRRTGADLLCSNSLGDTPFHDI